MQLESFSSVVVVADQGERIYLRNRRRLCRACLLVQRTIYRIRNSSNTSRKRTFPSSCALLVSGRRAWVPLSFGPVRIKLTGLDACPRLSNLSARSVPSRKLPDAGGSYLLRDGIQVKVVAVIAIDQPSDVLSNQSIQPGCLGSLCQFTLRLMQVRSVSEPSCFPNIHFNVLLCLDSVHTCHLFHTREQSNQFPTTMNVQQLTAQINTTLPPV